MVGTLRLPCCFVGAVEVLAMLAQNPATDARLTDSYVQVFVCCKVTAKMHAFVFSCLASHLKLGIACVDHIEC